MATQTTPRAALTQNPAPEIDLTDLVGQTLPTELQPLAFFVSWHGVLTIAYKCFTNPLMHLKARVNEMFELPKESPGSKWPKTTLAALKNGVTLTQEQYQRIENVCKRLSPDLASCTVKVDSLEIVNYTCRSLERVVTKRSIELKGEVNKDWLETERLSVQRVLDEAKDPEYWQMVAKQGCRESHYRDFAPGCTLLIPIKKRGQKKLQEQIAIFQEEVDKALPDFFTFFNPGSQHITLRAIS